MFLSLRRGCKLIPAGHLAKLAISWSDLRNDLAHRPGGAHTRPAASKILACVSFQDSLSRQAAHRLRWGHFGDPGFDRDGSAVRCQRLAIFAAYGRYP